MNTFCGGAAGIHSDLHNRRFGIMKLALEPGLITFPVSGNYLTGPDTRSYQAVAAEIRSDCHA